MAKKDPAMLHLLATTACDYNPLLDISVSRDPERPDYVKVSTLHGQTALDRMGWNGFSSDDL